MPLLLKSTTESKFEGRYIKQCMSTQLLTQDTRKDTGPPLAPCVLGYKWIVLHKLSLCSMFITVKG